jgi:zinc/manganese transport system ATP-binding protein
MRMFHAETPDSATASPTPREHFSPEAATAGDGSVVALRDVAIRLGQRTIWQHATIDIAGGEFVAILGPNGAGKSTLLRILLGLLQPSAGRVMVLGRAPRRGRPDIGYVPQRRTLESDLMVRGRDFVALGVDGHYWGFALPGPAQRRQRERVQQAIEAVEATAYADRAIGTLSGGEQQRLLLAQALVGEPRLLVLDEPLASLDLYNQQAIAQLVNRVARAQGMTVLLVAHDVNPLLPVVDRVVYVARGQVTLGTPAEIITTATLSRLYNTRVEVLHDSQGRVFVAGLDAEATHPHD